MSAIHFSAVNVCAGIVTYHPDAQWPQRLARIQAQVSRLVVVDNSIEPAKKSFVKSICDEQGHTLISNTRNAGIAGALNQAATWATDNHFTAMIVFDQDSDVSQDVAPALFDVCTLIDTQDVAILGSNAINRTSSTYSAGGFSDEPGAFVEREVVLFSGAMIFLNVWQQLGGFNDALFMDLVDLEYCWRATRNGRRVLQALKPTMTHSAGQPQRHTLFGKTFYTINHNPKRYYYMMRNAVALKREYPDKITWPRQIMWAGRVLAFEPQKSAKLRWMIKGLRHGLNNTFINP